MSKYYKAEDVINKYAETIASEDWWKYGVDDFKVDKDSIDEAKMYFADLPTIEVSEDAISREDAIKAYNEAVDELVKAEMEEFNLGDFTECSFNTTQLKLIARKIESAPSVLPKAKEGEWKLVDHLWECDCCQYRQNKSKPTNYCPNCGADMRGGKDD